MYRISSRSDLLVWRDDASRWDTENISKDEGNISQKAFEEKKDKKLDEKHDEGQAPKYPIDVKVEKHIEPKDEKLHRTLEKSEDKIQKVYSDFDVRIDKPLPKSYLLRSKPIQKLLEAEKPPGDSKNVHPTEQKQEDGPDSMTFRDQKRTIHMVLAYQEDEFLSEVEVRKRQFRKTFQENLIKNGLELELEDKQDSFDEKTYFLKVHLPETTERQLAEVLHLQPPVKRLITVFGNEQTRLKAQTPDPWWYRKWKQIHYIDPKIHKEPSFFKALNKGGDVKGENFIVKERYDRLSPAQKNYLVWQILQRTKYDESIKMGIRVLLNNSTYLSCYPLHDGNYDSNRPDGTMCQRRLLYLQWGRICSLLKRQPLYLIRWYYGDEIGLYFCWLGFYTNMLYAPAFVGVICFIYGCLTLDSRHNQPSKEVCDENQMGSTILCPLCDKACKYFKLKHTCFFSNLTHLFDNPATVFFAVFMSIWAATFLSLWQRRQAVLIWEWDLQRDPEEESMRSQFVASVKTLRMNPVTGEKEPYLPFWEKALRHVVTSAAVMFMMCIMVCLVLGIIMYRISMMLVFYSDTSAMRQERQARLFSSLTAAIINLLIILSLEKVYSEVATFLSNHEKPRTQEEFEQSFTYKMFVFEFINYYSSLIYIAFFKGRFYDYPGDLEARRTIINKLKNDMCDPAGCLAELCIQLAIIMIGKQIIFTIFEILYPNARTLLRKMLHRRVTVNPKRKQNKWEIDYHLWDPKRKQLFNDYQEMIVQYGFLTLFVAAFPLAPLCALLNNIFEIKTDALKLVCFNRRNQSERVDSIGAWFGILKALTYAAVIMNAFVIAYTSDFIPRMVYTYTQSENHTLNGYVSHSLSWFNTSDYLEDWRAPRSPDDPEMCAFWGFRNHPNDPEPYDLSPYYWHVFAARLSFVVVFEHIIFSVTGLLQFFIPNSPIELRTQIRREAILAQQMRFEKLIGRTVMTKKKEELTKQLDEAMKKPEEPGENLDKYGMRRDELTKKVDETYKRGEDALKRIDEIAKKDDELIKRMDDFLRNTDNIRMKDDEFVKKPNEQFMKKMEEIAKKDDELIKKMDLIIKKVDKKPKKNFRLAKRLGEFSKKVDRAPKTDKEVSKMLDDMAKKDDELIKIMDELIQSEDDKKDDDPIKNEGEVIKKEDITSKTDDEPIKKSGVSFKKRYKKDKVKKASVSIKKRNKSSIKDAEPIKNAGEVIKKGDKSSIKDDEPFKNAGEVIKKEDKSSLKEDEIVKTAGALKKGDKSSVKFDDTVKKEDELIKKDDKASKKDHGSIKKTGEFIKPRKLDDELIKKADDFSKKGHITPKIDNEIITKAGELIKKVDEATKKDREVNKRLGEMSKKHDELIKRTDEFMRMVDNATTQDDQVTEMEDETTIKVHDLGNKSDELSEQAGSTSRGEKVKFPKKDKRGKKMGRPTKHDDESDDKMDELSKKLNELELKIDEPVKKVDELTKKVDELTKKIEDKTTKKGV